MKYTEISYFLYAFKYKDSDYFSNLLRKAFLERDRERETIKDKVSPKPKGAIGY